MPESTGAGELTPADLAFLDEAAKYLEAPSFLMRTADLVGKPVQALVSALPGGAREVISKATTGSLERGLNWAIRTLPDKPPGAAEKPPTRTREFFRRHGHTALSAVTGAGGGFFGVAGLPVELPATTMVMLRSIAAVAVEHGADLDDPRTRIECLAVLSFGSEALSDMESSYFTTRLALAMSVRQAAVFVTHHGAREIAEALTRGTAPALLRLISVVASRFQVTVTQKVAVQSVPVLGAAMGALVNAAFTDHFNRVARYHFGIVALEKRYGAERVQAAYERSLRNRKVTRNVNLRAQPADGA